MDDVINSTADIVNLSAGRYHGDCMQNCRICKAAEKVADEGKIIVSGAGYSTEDQDKTLYCPAYSNRTISVGSFVSECTCEVAHSSQGDISGPSVEHPAPGAYKLENDYEDVDPYNLAVCGYRDCSPIHSCSEYLDERPVKNDVSASLGHPDVYAPSHTISRRDNGEIYYETGTSFSTAIVSGALSAIISELHGSRPIPNVKEVRSAITQSGETVGDTNRPKLDMESIYHYLR